MGNETYYLLIVILVASLILVFIDAIIKIYYNNKEYNKSSFRLLTNIKLYKVLSNRHASKMYKLFNVLEKNCITGHLLCNLNIKDENGNNVNYDLVMIDKYGISVFDVESEIGVLSGNYNMPFWKMKKGLLTRKIPNYSLVLNRKLEVLKETLKITDSSIISGYIIFDRECKFKNMRFINKNIKIIKEPYLHGQLVYETSNLNRVLSDTDIMSYTILLEKYTSLPVYLRDERIMLRDKNKAYDLDDDNISSKTFCFEFYRQVTNYNDLKKIWEVLLKCDKDTYPPFSLRRNDIDEIPSYSRQMLLPNNYYKEVIHHPLILIRKNKEIIGFLSIQPNKILKLSEELGRVNLLDNACVLKEYRKEGLIKDLYLYVEKKIPMEYFLPYILVKSSVRNDYLNRILCDMGYKEKIIVDTKAKYGADTVYYFKKANIEDTL